MDEKVICLVDDCSITALALKAIDSLGKISKFPIQFRAITGATRPMGLQFFTTSLSENDRAAWENIIRGIIIVM